MARMLPELTEMELDRLDSRAEARVYRACRDGLAERLLVLHRAEWIVRKPGRDVGDGEADFLVCDPDAGIVVLEVKGGGVRFEPAKNAWSSTDAAGGSHRIKDPFRQARDAKHAVLGKLQEHRRWSQIARGRINLGHGVVFPDLTDVSSFNTPRSPRAIIAGAVELSAFPDWLDHLLEFWRGDGVRCQPPGRGVLGFIEEIFARPLEARPVMSTRLSREEEVRIRLTADQSRVLALLGGRRRAAICGGAGTGKTVLALEKATRLAAEGFRTLLLCYNRPLADSLARLAPDSGGPEVWSFHAFCVHRIERARREGRDLIAEAATAEPRGDYFDLTLPLALAYSVDVLDDRYDAVVVDEAQDFREEYWLPIELLLADGDRSPLYLFYDQNQSLYSTAASFPVRDEPFVLTSNCRNTRSIHSVSYQFFLGQPTDPPVIDGLPVCVVEAETLGAQCWAIQKILNRLIVHEGVRPAEIAVLVAEARNKDAYYDALAAIPSPAGVPWCREDHHSRQGVLVDTVHRFKGLEKDVVLLWLSPTTTPESSAEVLYVGSSRAKALLYVVGPACSCGWARGG